MSPAEQMRLAATAIRNRVPQHDPTGWSDIERPERIRHIRYVGDHSGYQHPARRLWRTIRSIVGPRSPIERALGIERGSWAQAKASVKVNLPADSHLPDAVLYGGSVICFWIEHAWHVALWSPEVAQSVAEALDAVAATDPGPDHPMMDLTRRINDHAGRRPA